MVVHTDCNALSSLHSLKNWGHDPVKVKKQQDGEANGGAAPPAKKDADVEKDVAETEEETQPVANGKESKSTATDAEMKEPVSVVVTSRIYKASRR